MIVATADFETANTAGVDLTKVGADAYSADPNTEILCLCVKWTDPRLPVRPGEPIERRHTWRPGMPTDTLEALASDPMVMWEAHGASFEQLIWGRLMADRYGLPNIPIHRWSCTMASALFHGLPGKLERVAEVLQLREQKDMEGSALTVGLSKPITKLAWNTPEGYDGWRPKDWAGTQIAWANDYKPIYDRRPRTLARVEQYCWQDVHVEEELSRTIGGLSAYERRVWEHDQLVNQRGVLLDLPMVHAAMHVIEGASRAYADRFAALTGGLSHGQLEQIHGWLQGNGVTLPNLRAETVDKVLGGSLEDVLDGVVLGISTLPDHVREVLEIRRLLGATAIKKYPKMVEWCGPDAVARYLIQYHGAGTGRFAGRGFQPHNFPRLGVMLKGAKGMEPVDPELVVAAIMTGDFEFVEAVFGENALKVCAKALRHAIMARPGRTFNAADFAGIEMRIVLALAGQHEMCQMLKDGLDVYLYMAEDIYKQPRGSMDKHIHVQERTIGKNTILGCGFQMSGPTFHSRYCSHMPAEFAAEVVNTYRTVTAPLVPKLWKAFEETALRCVQEGTPQQTHGCRFVMRGPWLTVELPDDQVMWYRNPRLCTGRFGNPGWECQRWKDGQWKWVQMYGGLTTENIVQKMARGLLCEAMQRVEQHGFQVVLHVHDEIVAETDRSGDLQEEYEQLMAVDTAWARNIRIPIGVEGWSGPRFRK